MYITINTIESHMDIPDYMTAEEIRIAMLYDEHVGMLDKLIIYSLEYLSMTEKFYS